MSCSCNCPTMCSALSFGAKPSAIEKFEELKTRETRRRPNLASYRKFEMRNQSKSLQDQMQAFIKELPTLPDELFVDIIEGLQAEAERRVDLMAQVEKDRNDQNCGGVPLASIKHSMVARAGPHPIQQYTYLVKQG